jgi:hypothetical protein
MSGPAPPLEERARARGRLLAIASHPAGNTFRHVFTQQLPTLALVALGASELQVGLQGSFIFAFVALQLPTLRTLSHVSKRGVLVGAHVFALATGLPLVFFDHLAALPQGAAVALAQLSFALVAVGHCIGETIWFPLLYAYLDRENTGRFFGVLRTGWHLALILFFAASQWWLARHPAISRRSSRSPGESVWRAPSIVRMPERRQTGGERIRVRDALALARAPLRRYLATVSQHACRVTATVFGIVMMRRAVGLGRRSGQRRHCVLRRRTRLAGAVGPHRRSRGRAAGAARHGRRQGARAGAARRRTRVGLLGRVDRASFFALSALSRASASWTLTGSSS